MNIKHFAAAAAAVTFGALSGTAQATLLDRGKGLIYDDALNITWLQDWNYAKTSGYDADGRMSWEAAVTWADQLTYGGFSDWRLPTIVDTGTPGCDFSSNGTDCGYNVQTASNGTVYSEMAHVYYATLGNKAYCAPGIGYCSTSQAGFGFINTGLFAAEADSYWSGTEASGLAAWYFDAGNGSQGVEFKSYEFRAVAVRSGDVLAVSAVPEPETYALMLAGLAVLTAVAKQRRRSR
jgi:hypothetical protein